MLKVFVIAASMAALSSPAGAQAPAAVQGPEIVVSGRGETKVPSDRAVITVDVRTQARNASEAAARNSEKVTAIEARVAQVGTGAPPVSTARYAVQPVYRYTDAREQVFTGNCIASHTLTVQVSELSRIGSLIDAILESGATQIVGTAFEASNLDEARASALRAAVAQAQSDATIMAEAAGGQLGELTYLSTEPERVSAPGIRLEALEINGLSTQITPSAQIISATVVGRWRFRPSPR